MYVVSGFSHEDPLFASIEIIFVCGQKIAFLITPNRSIFDSHSGSYELILDDSSGILVVTIDELVDFYPLTAYRVNESLFISYKHVLLDEML